MSSYPAHEVDAAVGRRVHMLMWDRHLSQTALAPTLGIDQSALSKKMRGVRPWTLDELVAISAHLRTSIAYLVGEVDDSHPYLSAAG
jgi:predicted transcriptional regulator